MPKSSTDETTYSSQNSLIDTIKVPKNRKDFAFCLPKSKYESPLRYSNKTETSIENTPSILDCFMSPMKRLHPKQPGIARSEKRLLGYPSEKSYLQSPSFKDVLSMKPQQRSSIMDEISAEQLKLRRPKLKITIGNRLVLH